MEQVNLGRCGMRVSRICLGAMTFGREADEQASFRIMDTFVEAGGTFIDTANAYSRGGSEQVVGRWLKARGNRDAIVVATKVYGEMGSGPNERGLARINIQRAVEASLKRLAIDTIDLYQIHRWDPTVPAEETLETLDDLVRQGKVRYAGCSNLAAWQIAKYLRIAEQRLLTRFVSLQPIFNALNRSAENELLPLCHDEGIGVICYNPLAGGVLTGKYRRGETLPDQGNRLAENAGYRRRYHHDETFDIVERFVAHARERGATPAQLALAWALGEPRLTCPIVGARTVAQLTDTLGGLAMRLSAEERAAVPAIEPGRWVGLDPVYDRERAG
jgi:aryl-alcohol dehydrogenase-like predicted oxidoreductase